MPDIEAFWRWFAERSTSLSEDNDHGHAMEVISNALAKHLDARVVPELGPGSRGDRMLAISPNGSRELLALCERTVGQAPPIAGWEFLVGRQPKDLGRGLEVSDHRGTTTLAPLSWGYQLLEHAADVPFDIVIDAPELVARETDVVDAQDIADIVLSSLIGEQNRIRLIHGILVFGINEAKPPAAKTIPLRHLRDHLIKLGWIR